MTTQQAHTSLLLSILITICACGDDPDGCHHFGQCVGKYSNATQSAAEAETACRRAGEALSEDNPCRATLPQTQQCLSSFDDCDRHQLKNCLLQIHDDNKNCSINIPLP